MARHPKVSKTVETLTHEDAKRKNIPTAEYGSVIDKETQSPVRGAYERRDRDLDPQLVWRGKAEQNWSDLVVHAPPLFIQEKVHPKVLIDDLLRQTERAEAEKPNFQADLFSDFNGLPDEGARTEFYRHDANWTNRMILGDSLQVMASLAEREGLRGKVQCIYLDPPYGIKFNSNFQWSTTSRDVKDGNTDHITREPEQVKAFRDTWRDGIHGYLTYLRDRLTVARDLLTDSGSIFVQIGECLGRNMNALGKVGNNGARHLVTMTREAPFVLKEFVEHGEPQTGRTCLIGKQGCLVRQKGKAGDEIVWLPLAFHPWLGQGFIPDHHFRTPVGALSDYRDEEEVPRTTGVRTLALS